jgi:outer membrane protein with beta-barrel domain
MKIIFLTLLSALTLSSTGQTLSYGLKAGVQENYFQEYYTKDYRVESSDFGFHIGGFAELNLAPNLTLQPSLLLTRKGGGYYDNNIRVLAVELPVNLLYRHKGFFIGGGPGISYGLSGKVSGDVDNVETNIYNDKSFMYQKRLDVQVGALMGYKLRSNIIVSAFMSRGLRNLTALEDNGSYNAKMKTFGLSIGYQIK